MFRVDTSSHSEVEAFRSALAAWYDRARRPLPWRVRPSLYGTVVSELMAQQTRIATMLPYYARWMERFPDFETLAPAPAADVLKHWEGLGYYSRARNLHRLAQVYIAMEKKPATAAEWAELPGIGPYTAAAVSSIALGFPAAVVDGNVVRILARLTSDTRTFSGNGEAVKAMKPLADELLDRGHPGRHNEAMMELGALVCVPGNPACDACPVARFCAAAGAAESLPRIERPVTERVEVDRVLCLRDGAVLLHRISRDAKRLAGQYELPEASAIGWEPSGKALATKTRSITNHRICERIHAFDATLLPASLPSELEWVPLDGLNAVTLSGPHRRWLGELLALPKPRP